jgi:hypothetical protein
VDIVDERGGLGWVHGVSPGLGVQPLLAGLPAVANAFYHVPRAGTDGIVNCAEALIALDVEAPYPVNRQ